MGKIYVGCVAEASKAPKEYADTAKKAIADGVKAALKKDSTFTDQKGEGYTIRMKVAELTVAANTAKCRLSGELVRAPKQEMVSTGMTGGATAQGGKPDDMVKDCISAVLDDLMPKVMKVMKDQARP